MAKLVEKVFHLKEFNDLQRRFRIEQEFEL